MTQLQAKLPLALVAVIACWLFMALWNHAAPQACNPDSDGYLIPARQLVTTGHWTRPHSSRIQFLSPNWFKTSAGTLISRYPPGLPLLLAPGWLLGEVSGALLINITLASFSVVIIYFLAAQLFNKWLSVVCALVWATYPSPAIHTLALDSHTAQTVFLLLGFYLLLSVWPLGQAVCAKRRAWIACAAGLSLGFLPVLHYAEGVILACALLWALCFVRPWSTCGYFLLGCSLPIIFAGLYNYCFFGLPWITAYSLSHEGSTLALINIRTNYYSYLNELTTAGLGLFFSLGLLGLGSMILLPERGLAHSRAIGLLFLSCTVSLAFLYLCYYFGDESATERFLIPLYPLLLLAGFWLLAYPRHKISWLILLLVASLQGQQNIRYTQPELLSIRYSLLKANTAVTAVAQYVPEQSVIITNNNLAAVLDPLGRWKLVDEAILLSWTHGLSMPHPCLPREQGFEADFELTSATWDPQLKDKSLPERLPLAWSWINQWRQGQRVFLLSSQLNPRDLLPQGHSLQGLCNLEAFSPIGIGAAPHLPNHPGLPSIHAFRFPDPKNGDSFELSLYEIVPVKSTEQTDRTKKS